MRITENWPWNSKAAQPKPILWLHISPPTNCLQRNYYKRMHSMSTDKHRQTKLLHLDPNIQIKRHFQFKDNCMKKIRFTQPHPYLQTSQSTAHHDQTYLQVPWLTTSSWSLAIHSCLTIKISDTSNNLERRHNTSMSLKIGSKLLFKLGKRTHFECTE